MKRFEIAIEISKQLISLCSALIVGTAALASSILAHEDTRTIFTMLVAQYILYIASIVAGICHIGAVANLIETAERRDFARTNPEQEPAVNGSTKFVSLFDNALAPIFCSIQQWLFVLAVILLVATVIADWNVG